MHVIVDSFYKLSWQYGISTNSIIMIQARNVILNNFLRLVYSTDARGQSHLQKQENTSKALSQLRFYATFHVCESLVLSGKLRRLDELFHHGKIYRQRSCCVTASLSVEVYYCGLKLQYFCHFQVNR